MSGAVSTSHYLATSAGERALRAGGSAVDAAIAAAAALCVVYPNNVALGGDLVALVRSPDGRIRFINATGTSARGSSLDTMRARYENQLPSRGIDTVTLPGGVAGWGVLHDAGARLPLGELLEPARTWAESAPVSRSVGAAIRVDRDALAADPGCAALFLPDGRGLVEGDTLRQPQLARTLETLQEQGTSAFYRGPLAARWIAGLRALGSALTEDDAAEYRPTVSGALTRRVFGLDLHTGRPNSQGFAFLRNAVTAASAAWPDPLGADAGLLARTFYASNSVRRRWLSDPDTAHHDADALIAMPEPASLPATAIAPATGDTVGLVAVDDDGWAVSLVQSVFWAFGACVLEPETGILFHNRGTSFSLDPRHPAAYAPSRRPPHTLMPVLVERSGALAYAGATMGGQAQAQIHTHLLLRLVAGSSALEATSAPRWVVGIQDDGDVEETVTIEADVPRAARDALADAGFPLRVVPPRDELLGHSNVIVATEQGWDAASDPRSDGSAVVVVAPEMAAGAEQSGRRPEEARAEE
ncbi:gamma-glutamyltranspeptidase [Rathayibacter tritici]|uniref:gamma-glutamyltransferase family protein n=1 Tax=Rathayibacter tritici TaxID=33888 RepID=UPI000CE78D25|nr:gamma-glutamyltransferase [Rathayibacter tritici]PPF29457.1 gamma-glutamyltranspeptidase [Rathayibacter tritici]PPF67111.1 gamma-glutamyltranspeptidase [Rathayibacter tritici]PPG06739.1 gamma-glutamyltranspeptidase [Rathayibacter tritici]PPI19482.1 gamma-glutamyltranspeptidase [Rathayibacter tritici]